jgi:hypothetical protein
MEMAEVEKKGVYLYLACYVSETEKQQAFIAVTKAMLYDEVAIDMENLGDHAILFTSTMPLSEIREKLKNKTPFLLIDLSVTYDLESVLGFLPDSKIELVRKITKNLFSKEKPNLKRKLDESVADEKFELAAALRDLTK